MNVRISWIALLIAVVTGLTGVAHAQTFPSKPIRIVVPFPAGGGADIVARILGDHMAKGLGQPFIVENRPGGSTIIGAELVARSPVDGHTLLMVYPSFVINPALREGMSFDPLKDFKAVGQTVSVPMVISVHPSVPAKSLKELIALASARPGEISYGTAGTGTLHHVIGEMLRLSTKTKIVHIPFQGSPPALNAAIGGHLQMLIGNATETAPSVKGGKIRAIVTTTAERADALPDVPTMREAGFPELEATNWGGLVVRTGTPPAVISRLNAELVRALRHPEVQEKLKANGMLTVPGTPEQFDTFMQTESARYAKVVREGGIKLD